MRSAPFLLNPVLAEARIVCLLWPLASPVNLRSSTWATNKWERVIVHGGSGRKEFSMEQGGHGGTVRGGCQVLAVRAVM